MRAVRVLVVDDEPVVVRGVARALSGRPGIDVVGRAHDGAEAVERILELAPDVVFLDVHMPELDGFGVLRALEPEERPLVVFVTAHDQHAVEAFEVHAVDYVLKPFDDARIVAALERTRERLAEGASGATGTAIDRVLDAVGSPRPLRRFLARSGSRIHFVPLDEVEWIEADGNYLRLHGQEGGRFHLVRETLTAAEARLDPATFTRVHRSVIVRLDRVVEIEAMGTGDWRITLRSGATVPLSRRYRDAFLERAAE